MASSSSPPSATLQYLAPPPGFAAVQAGVYRCGALPPGSFAFVRRLGIRTALWLSNEHPVRALTTFFQDTDTTFIHLGLKAWKPYATWKPISEELIKEALELVLDRATHPIMVMCASGIHHTGTLVGCLRRIQKWNLTSVIEEYRRYAGSKARYVNEQFIELFDEDLVTLPPSLPDWFLDQRRMMEEEEREYEAIEAMAAEKKRREGEEGEGEGVERRPEEREGRVGGEVETGRLLGSAREGEEGGDFDENRKKTDDISVDWRDDDGNVAENISGKETPTTTRRVLGSPLSMQTVSVPVTDGPPGYRKYYYSRSSPLTTEDREYKRKIIGKV